MYCVIQEIQRKKPNTYGAYKNLEAYSFSSVAGVPKYAYHYTGDRFERPIKMAYKISIHESKRVNGVVTKKQYAVTTVDYYSLIDWWIGDCINSPEKKIQAMANNLNTESAAVWDLINNKIDPLQERIKTEFQQTDEYKTHAEHERIIKKYQEEKAKFAKLYGCDESEYDYIFNVFGELMNKEYYDKIINDHRTKRSYHEKTYSNYSNFNWSSFQNNGGSSDSYNLFGSKTNVYTDAEKSMLKNFYKTLSKAYHPDITKSDSTEMQLINKLKEAWGI